MNYLSLFSGIGGIDLGLDRAGFTCVGQVEIDPFCRAVLARHWPRVPRFEDVRTFIGDEVGPVDLVAGGFPCQPVSLAGRGRAQADDRWLWPEMLRIIATARPGWVLAENVPGLRNRGADIVLRDLEGLGYASRAIVVGAEHVGAPHKRHRVWIVANGEGCGRTGEGERGQPEAGGRADVRGGGVADPIRGHGRRWLSVALGKPQGRAAAGGAGDRVGELADAGRERRQQDARSAFANEVQHARWAAIDDYLAQRAGEVDQWPARPTEAQHGWEHTRLLVVNADACGFNEHLPERQGVGGGVATAAERAGEGTEAHGQGSSERGVGSATDGISAELVRASRRHNRNTLKAAGNSVVPQVVELLGRAIATAAESPTLFQEVK